MKRRYVVMFSMVVLGFLGFQLYRYNTTETPMLIHIYRYKNNKLISSESFVNDAGLKCERN